jgi:hypothetical protein
MKILKLLFPVLFFTIVFSFNSCEKHYQNPYIPNIDVDITIDPNSTLFLELNTPGGWCYLDNKPGVYIPYGSRGIIVYRQDMYTFLAYERTPPNDPNKCCQENMTNCSKLTVDYPMVVDSCTGITYSILDGGIIEGNGVYPLMPYKTQYNGNLLRIYN